MRGVIDSTEYSDFQFFQDFERDFDRNSRRFEESQAFVTGNWGTHLVNLQVSDRETFSRHPDQQRPRAAVAPVQPAFDADRPSRCGTRRST